MTEPPVIWWLGGEGGGDPIGSPNGVDEMPTNISWSGGESIDRREEVGECPVGNVARWCDAALWSGALVSEVEDEDEEDCS